MTVHEYIQEKKAQLGRWERTLEENTSLGDRIAPLRAKRDEVAHKLEALAQETSDRWDIVRMGFESAWAELQAAFETALKEPVERTERPTKH